MSAVRDETPRDRGPGELRLPDAPRGRERRAREVPPVRHEAIAGLGCRLRIGAGDARSRPHAHDQAHHDHAHVEAGGIEWEDDMVDVNRITTPANTRWSLVDKDTGAANHAIDWQFRVGDRIKLRLVNEMDSDHPMHHPFHVHGAGRFVVLARDGVADDNLVWKDTVLVRTGETVDILLDVTNAGIWMAHCHIAEHHESGMMFGFNVSPADDVSSGVNDRQGA